MLRLTESCLKGQFRCMPASCIKPLQPLRYAIKLPGCVWVVTHKTLADVVVRSRYLALPVPEGL